MPYFVSANQIVNEINMKLIKKKRPMPMPKSFCILFLSLILHFVFTAHSVAAVPEAYSGFQNPTSESYSTNGYAFLEGPINYGCSGGSVYHPGRDLNIEGTSGDKDRGTDVLAVADGVVRDTGFGSGEWGTVVIEHNYKGTTVYSQYGHLDSTLVQVGDKVTKGQHIGEMGDNETADVHLHFEIRKSSHPNPTNAPAFCSVLGGASKATVSSYYEDPLTFISNHPAYVYDGNTLYANFTGSGLWKWHGTAWCKLTSLVAASMVASDTNLYANFTGSGLYSWDGKTWSRLTSLVAASMVVSGTNLYANFTGYGLYQWNGTAWSKLTSLVAADMVTSTRFANSTILYANFTGYGLYRWDGTAWSKLTSLVAASLVACHVSGDLYASFTGHGLYKYGKAWNRITTLVPVNMVAYIGSPLYANFPGHGLYSWDGKDWSKLTSWVADSMVACFFFFSPLYANFTGHGLYSWDRKAWCKLTSLVAVSMVAPHASGDLYASFTGHGLYKWNGKAWNRITTLVPVNMVVPRPY